MAEGGSGGQAPLSPRRPGTSKTTPLTVVGVVGNAMDAGYGLPPGEAVYVPYSQISSMRISIVAEGRGSTAATVAAIKRALKNSDPVVAAGNVATLDALVLQANALPRLRTLVLLMFAIVAVGIVALGSYGVMSQLVSTREREFAVRLVFGARPEQLGRAVILQVARITLPGVAVGLVAMWLLSGALKSFVFGVQPTSAAVLATSERCCFCSPSWRPCRARCAQCASTFGAASAAVKRSAGAR